MSVTAALSAANPPATRGKQIAVRVVASGGWAEEAHAALREAGFDVETDDGPLPECASESPMVLADVACGDFGRLGLANGLRRSASIGYDPGEMILVGPEADPPTRSAAMASGAFDLLSDPPDVRELVAAFRGLASARRRTDRLRRRLGRVEAELERQSVALETARIELVGCLTKASVYRDGETGMHLGRVGNYAEVIAEALGCDRCFVSQIGMAAPLHDIGKIGVPDAVLLKPGRFTPEERREMERHVEIGGDIVRSLEVGNDDATRSPMLAMAMRIAMTHHEWFDGTGYPKGLAGEDIPLEGRITAIADVFDALTNERPYKPAFGLTKTLRILGEGRGRQFDPDVFDAFLRSLDRIVDLRYGDGATEGDE